VTGVCYAAHMTSRTAKRVLRQHLMTDQLLGVAEVPVGNAEPQAAVAEAEVHEAPTIDAIPIPLTDAQQTLDAANAEPYVAHAADVKLQLLQAIDENEVKSCTMCELHAGRTQTVFGDGSATAEVMFIGEGPGQNEDEQGIPFVGRAGQLLNKMIVAMGLSRETVYIANTVKCRPPNNRTPTPAEVDTCWTYLSRQIEIISPKAIVTLGGPATKIMLNTKKGITALRGTWHRYDALVARGGPSIPVMPTFHPAYLLRAYTDENRRKVWSDLQAVMEVIK